MHCSNEVGADPKPTLVPPLPAAKLLPDPLLNISLTILSGILASLIFLPHEWWWLDWIALVPFLIALRRLNTMRASGWSALLFGIVFIGIALPWLIHVFGPVTLGVVIIAALPFVLFGLLYRLLVMHAGCVLLALMTPVLWLAVDWIRCEGWYFRFSWAQLGFAFTACRHASPLYASIGVYGATFLVVLVNAVIVELLLVRKRWAVRIGALAGCGILLAIFSLYLMAPAGKTDAPISGTIPVGIVQSESSDLRTMQSLTNTLTQQPRIIVWPEYAIYDYPLSDARVMASLQRTAQASHAILVLGCKEHVPPGTPCDPLRERAMRSMEGDLSFNTALLIGADGAVIGTYHKTHPIQFFADGVPGRSYPTFSTPYGRVGVAICYDFDFATTARTLVQHGAELLVVPTYDASRWTGLQHRQHARIAQARAAEVGRWVIRATSSGVSQVIDPTGHCVITIPNDEQTAITAVVAGRSNHTPYVRYGYLLPYLCLCATFCWLACLSAAWLYRRKRSVQVPAGIPHELT